MADTPASSSDLDSGDRTHINLGGTRGGGAKWHGRPRNTEPTKTKKDRQSALEAALANASKESSAFFEMFTAQMAAAEKAREERDERGNLLSHIARFARAVLKVAQHRFQSIESAYPVSAPKTTER